MSREIAATEIGLLPLRVRGLTYRVRDTRLIDGLDLDLDGTGITVVMGPNGAGKSLLLRLLHGLIEPTAGQIHWNGQPQSLAVRHRQALVFQRPVLLRRSVLANIEFVLSLSGGKDRALALNLLERVGLAGKENRPARRLSGGEQQRLAMARALALSPQVLFMDEPTASLDPTATAAIEQITATVSRSGTKVIYVTHDIGQARRLADDVVFMNHGRIAEHSPAQPFFKQPQSSAARDYLAGQLVF